MGSHAPRSEVGTPPRQLPARFWAVEREIYGGDSGIVSAPVPTRPPAPRAGPQQQY